jgi:citrate lyase subunit beta/citryl-CoA lyase
MLEKARALPADEVVIDLEDSVPPGAKDAARAAAAAAVRESWKAPAVAVRVNAVGGEWWERDVGDLAAAGGSLSSLVIPKCQGPDGVLAVDSLLDGEIGIQALIETAAGLVAVREIASSSERLESLIVGFADLAASLGRPAAAEYPGDRWHFARETVLVNARAAGLAAIDGPYLAIEDEDGLRASAAEARALGYDGKWAIHPSQLEPLNELFTPNADEVDRARAVLGALDGAAGAAALEGEMIDEASRKQAEIVVARAEAAG